MLRNMINFLVTTVNIKKEAERIEKAKESMGEKT
jgi:hypothetical protein